MSDPARERAEQWLAEQCRAAYHAGVMEWDDDFDPEAMGWQYVARIAAGAIAKAVLAERDACLRLTADPIDPVTGTLPNADEISLAIEARTTIPWHAIEEGE